MPRPSSKSSKPSAAGRYAVSSGGADNGKQADLSDLADAEGFLAWLAEVIGTAIALNLLFGIPLSWGVGITALDVLIVLYLQNKGFRLLEALVVALVATVGACFLFEIIRAKPDVGGIARGFIPDPEILRNPAMLYVAIGILGATVMPHNLYLHSSIVQTRKYGDSDEDRASAIRFATLDSTVALSSALFSSTLLKWRCCGSRSGRWSGNRRRRSRGNRRRRRNGRSSGSGRSVPSGRQHHRDASQHRRRLDIY